MSTAAGDRLCSDLGKLPRAEEPGTPSCRAVTGQRQHEDGWDVSVACDPVQRSGFAAKCKSAGFVIGGRKVRAAATPRAAGAADYDLDELMSGPVREIEAFIETHKDELGVEDFRAMLEWDKAQKKPRVTLVQELKALIGEEG